VTELVRGLHGSYSLSGEPFAAGGQAKVFSVTNAVGMVYKRFDDPLTDQTDVRRLGRLSTEGRRVFLEDKQSLGETPQSSILWPTDLIMGRAKSVLGIVMPRIPSRYFHAGGPARDLQWLFLRKTEPPAVAARVAVLIRFAEIMAWLRERDLVHGDLNQKNLVWAIDPHPSGILIDTDGIHSSTTGLRDGVQTPFWTDPRRVVGAILQHDVHSDAYLLSLAVYRTLYLTPGNLPRRSDGSFMKAKIRAGTPEPIGRMLNSALNFPLVPERRPEPKEWVEALHVTFFPKGKVNGKSVESIERINRAELSSTRAGTAARSPGNRPMAQSSLRPVSPAAPSTSSAPMSLVMLDARRARRRLFAYTAALVAVFGLVGAFARQNPRELRPWQLWGTSGPSDIDVRAIAVLSLASALIMLLIDVFVATKQRLRSGPFSPALLHVAACMAWIAGWIAADRTAAGTRISASLADHLGFDVRSTMVAGLVAAHLFVGIRDVARRRTAVAFGFVLAASYPFAFGAAVGRLGLRLSLF
jgi:hypothetical protein